MNLVTVLISYCSPRWTRVAVSSYLRQWPGERLLVVDNNPEPTSKDWNDDYAAEREWLNRIPGVILYRNRLYRSHGAGMDCALKWCRDQGVGAMVHIEPDCLVTGTRWRELLEQAVGEGAEMAGTHRYAFGPIHPCPSIWRTDVDWPSFQTATRTDDELHPRFPEVFDLPLRLKTAAAGGKRKWEFWSRNWDTAQRAWFHAAVRDKARVIDKASATGFKHYWKGSRENKNHSHLAELWHEFDCANQ